MSPCTTQLDAVHSQPMTIARRENFALGCDVNLGFMNEVEATAQTQV